MSGDCRVHSYLLLTTATIVMMRAAMEQKKCHPQGDIDPPHQEALWWKQCTFYAPIIGFSPSTRNCCTHRRGTMQRWLVKRTGLAVDWEGYLHILDHQKSGSHLLQLPDFLTGLEVCVMRIRCRSGFLHIGPSGHSPTPVKGGWVQNCQSLMGSD